MTLDSGLLFWATLLHIEFISPMFGSARKNTPDTAHF